MPLRLLIVVLLALVAACGTDAEPKAEAPAPPPVSASPQGPIVDRCPPEEFKASRPTELTVTTADGIELFAAEFGSGPRGVVLAHGTGASAMCLWANVIPALEHDGYHVLAIDHRCQGYSGCDPSVGEALDEDLVAAVAELRGRGARTVTLMGESRGGAVVLAAAARPDADVDAVAALSGVWFDGIYTGPDPAPLEELVTRIDVPVLYLSSLDDDGVDQTAYRALSADTKDSEYVALKHGGHGAVMLGHPDPSRTYRTTLRTFLAEHSG